MKILFIFLSLSFSSFTFAGKESGNAQFTENGELIFKQELCESKMPLYSYVKGNELSSYDAFLKFFKEQHSSLFYHYTKSQISTDVCLTKFDINDFSSLPPLESRRALFYSKTTLGKPMLMMNLTQASLMGSEIMSELLIQEQLYPLIYEREYHERIAKASKVMGILKASVLSKREKNGTYEKLHKDLSDINFLNELDRNISPKETFGIYEIKYNDSSFAKVKILASENSTSRSPRVLAYVNDYKLELFFNPLKGTYEGIMSYFCDSPSCYQLNQLKLVLYKRNSLMHLDVTEFGFQNDELMEVAPWGVPVVRMGNGVKLKSIIELLSGAETINKNVKAEVLDFLINDCGYKFGGSFELLSLKETKTKDFESILSVWKEKNSFKKILVGLDKVSGESYQIYESSCDF